MSIYGLILGICFVIGITFFQKNNSVIPKKLETKFLIGLLVSAIVGARIYSIINYWSYFFQNPTQILNLRGGGLGIFGGLIGGIIFIYIFSKKNKIKFLNITNLIVPVIPLCQSLGRWGNFFNHEIYSANGQPVWLYESIFMFILFLVFKKIKSHQTAYYLFGYGIIRFILEFIRIDTIKICFLSLGQILSLLFILFSFIIIKYENSSNKPRFN